MKISVLAGGLCALLLTGAAQAAEQQYRAVLTGASEVPAVQTPGSGQLLARYDTKTKQLTYTLVFAGLTGPAAMAHFHGPAAVGVNAAVVVPINGDLSAPVHASVTLTDAQAKELAEGKWYVNVHTAANKGGEIRGQVALQK
jgi:hypothetical protein